jgi:hypothetical protein
VVGGVLGSLFGVGSALIAVHVHGARWVEAPYPVFFSQRHVLAYDVFLLAGLAVGAGFFWPLRCCFCRFGRYPRTDAFGALLIGMILSALSTAILLTRLVAIVRGA